MTKADLINDVARDAHVTKAEADAIVQSVLDSIIFSLKEGKKVELRGFGSFRVRQRSGRIGRNPKSGESVNVPAKRIPYFKLGKELKELINRLDSNTK